MKMQKTYVPVLKLSKFNTDALKIALALIKLSSLTCIRFIIVKVHALQLNRVKSQDKDIVTSRCFPSESDCDHKLRPINVNLRVKERVQEKHKYIRNGLI